MKANSFTMLHESFSHTERQKFRLFLQSPYFNRSATAIRLYNIHTSLEMGTLDYKDIWVRLYPGKELAENQLRKHYSDLYQLARNFLAIEELARSPNTSSLLRMRRFIRTHSPNGLRAEIKVAQARLPSMPHDYPDTESYWFAAQLGEFDYYLDAHERRAMPKIDQAVSQLDGAYLLSKLKFLCEIASARNVFHYSDGFLFEREVLSIATSPPFCDYVLIKIYFLIYAMFTKHNQQTGGNRQGWVALERDYDQVVDLLAQNQATLSVEELQRIENYLQNICIQRLAYSDIQFEEKLDELYGLRLTSGSIFLNGYLRPEDYKNRVSLLLKRGKTSEAWEFIHAYADKLLPDFKVVAMHFNLGSYYYHVGDYGRMRRELVVVLNQDAYYILDSKALMIKAYFWEHDIDALKLHLESLKAYLWRNTKLAATRIQVHKIRYRFFEKLLRLMGKKTIPTSRIEKLRAEILACQPLLDQQFLLDLLQKWRQV